MGQQRIQKAKSKTPTQETVSSETSASTELTEQTDELLESIDEVLDDQLLAEIDDVLEQDAEQFVAEYIQVGGE